MGHIARAVDKDEQADKRDHHQHHRCEWIEHPAQLQPFASILKPGKVEDFSYCISVTADRECMGKCAECEKERQPHGTDRKRRCKLAISLFGKSAQSRRESRKCGNQPKISDNPGHVVSTKSYRVDGDLEFPFGF